MSWCASSWNHRLLISERGTHQLNHLSIFFEKLTNTSFPQPNPYVFISFLSKLRNVVQLTENCTPLSFLSEQIGIRNWKKKRKGFAAGNFLSEGFNFRNGKTRSEKKKERKCCLPQERQKVILKIRLVVLLFLCWLVGCLMYERMINWLIFLLTFCTYWLAEEKERKRGREENERKISW